MKPDILESVLLAILEDQPDGISEFELLKRLQTELGEQFPPGLFKDNLAMFRAHFLLFHALYRLQDVLCADGRFVQVDVLNTRLSRYGESRCALPSRSDPMRTYYLDLSNLDQTDAADVENMLGKFWAGYFARGRRAEALGVLGLHDPVDRDTVTRRYRRLAMELHPDRGGDTRRFQALQDAMTVLRRC